MKTDHPTPSPPQPAAFPPDPAAGTGSSAGDAPVDTDSQAGGCPAGAAPPRPAEPPAHCLYFLVCADQAGRSAGLFKLGITDDLAVRHRTHVRHWGAFDLGRSALLRAGSRQEAELLERHLRLLFAHARRDPGSRAEGHREFYLADHLEPMLARAESLLACHGGGGPGPRAQRGIRLADCGLDPVTDPLSRAVRRAESRARREAQWQQQQEQEETAANQVLALALEYEQHLVWVDLGLWRHSQLSGGGWLGHEGWAGLYFGPGASGGGSKPEQRTAVRARLEACCAPGENLPLASVAEVPREWAWSKGRRCPLLPPGTLLGHLPLPHPVCAGTLLLRLMPQRLAPHHPVFAQYAALARRVEGRHRWEEPEFRW